MERKTYKEQLTQRSMDKIEAITQQKRDNLLCLIVSDLSIIIKYINK